MADAFVIDSDRPGGAQRVTYDLVKEMYARDSNHRLVYFRETKSVPMPFIRNIYIFGLSSRNTFDIVERAFASVFGRLYRFLMSPLYSYQLYRQIKCDNFQRIFLVSDVAFSHFWFLKFFHPNVIIILHSKKSVQYKIATRPINKYLFRWSVSGTPLIAVSQSIADDLEFFGLQGTHISIRYNFTDYKRIKNLAKQGLINNLGDESYYLFIGRLSPEKNVEEIITEFSKSCTKSGLVICGDGPEKTKLQNIAKKLAVDNIFFLGHVDNPYPIIKGAKAVVMNSNREGFPTVIKEALLLSTPVVSNRSFYELEDLLGSSNNDFIVSSNNSICSIISRIDAAELKFNFNSVKIEKYAFGGIDDFF